MNLINHEINIHRDLTEIYTGYCHDLEKYFNAKEAIWGRSYSIYIKPKFKLTINEIFSPYLTNNFLDN